MGCFRINNPTHFYSPILRNFGEIIQLTEKKYRYGFNGQEKDNEVAGEGNINTALFWEYDTRLGRRWNLDPKPETSISDYACLENNPIWHLDPLGDKIIDDNGNEAEVSQRKNGKYKISGSFGIFRRIIINVMLRSPKGVEVLKQAEASPTRITIRLYLHTKQLPKTAGRAHAITFPGGETDDGNNYKTAEINLALFGHGLRRESNRFHKGGFWNVMAAILGHEFVHASNKEQHNKEKDANSNGTFGTELLPFIAEKEILEELNPKRANTINRIYKVITEAAETHKDMKTGSHEGKTITGAISAIVRELNKDAAATKKEQDKK